MQSSCSAWFVPQLSCAASADTADKQSLTFRVDLLKDPEARSQTALEKPNHFIYQFCVSLDDFVFTRGFVETGATWFSMKRKWRDTESYGIDILKTFQPLVWMLPGKEDVKWCVRCRDSRPVQKPRGNTASAVTGWRLSLQGIRSNANKKVRLLTWLPTQNALSHAFWLHSSFNRQWQAKIFYHLFTLFFYSQHRKHLYSSGKEMN